jgi:hypothetical protein
MLSFIAVTYIPLTYELFRLAPLENARTYRVMGIVVLVREFVVRAIWRAPWLNRFASILHARLET